MPYYKTLFVALFFMLIAAAMTAGFAKLIEPVLDNVLVAKKESLVIPMALAVAGVFILNGISTYIHTVLMNKIGLQIVSDIQRDLFGHFLRLDIKFFQEYPSGQLLSRVINDVNMVRNTVAEGITGIGKSLLTLILLVALMFYQDWQLACFALGVFMPAALFVGYLGKRLRKLSKSIQAEVGDLADTLSQIFQGIRQVKAYGMEDFERDRSGVVIERVRKLMLKGVRVGTLSTPFNETLIGFAIMGLVIYGGSQVINETLTAGELMSFIAAFSLSYEPLKKLAKLNNSMQMGLGAGERILDMLDRTPEIKDVDGAILLHSENPSITFENVVFGYNDDERNALDDVSFDMPAGKVTALVGASGSGKTTALNMVPRFYDPVSGQITIDGKNMRDFTLESLRKHIALVSQDVTIFDDTARANIAYGKPDASEQEIILAAKAAAAHDFINDMPQGYDTILGEHGTKLSGGQRQRIAIARAILRNAPILLLDEATSALDNESEKAIQSSLAELQKGRTVLVIAHRLSTVQGADQIIVLDQGKIAEQGNHEELMKVNKLYARMYRAGLET
ncbi:MAG: ABC transporter transmembrane domain-containing protein [Pseudomonadota bacterium]|nr:ABC transporter transmembrane domain-containing protein [Pseudomonadota bacterium]